MVAHCLKERERECIRINLSTYYMQREPNPFIWSKLPEDVVFTINAGEVYEFDMYIYTRES